MLVGKRKNNNNNVYAMQKKSKFRGLPTIYQLCFSSVLEIIIFIKLLKSSWM